MELLEKHEKEAWNEYYKWYCRVHRGYGKIEKIVKEMEHRVLSKQDISLEKFEEAVLEKHEAIKKMSEANLYYKKIKDERLKAKESFSGQG